MHPPLARPSTRFSSLAVAATLVCLTPVAFAQAPANACGDGKAILASAYPAAKPDSGTEHASYRLGDRRLMLPSQDSGNVPAMVCKVWPAHDNLLLIAVPRMDANQSLETDRVGDLDVMVVDRANNKVLQRMTLPDAMSDDAVQITKVEFDTARYIVAPGIQAFGLRTQRTGSSRVNPFGETTLHLFVMRDGASGPLRKVLDGLATSRSGGEWDGNCQGEFSERSAVLAMTKDVHNGYFDIRVTVGSQTTRQVAVGKDDCKESTAKDAKAQHTLVYDGKQYVVPAALKDL
jgi:hypothetical protein